MGLRNFFTKIAPSFEKGGKYQKFYPLYEMVETFFYTPKTVTGSAPHVRDYVDTKRIMTYVMIATMPALLFGLYNTGLQVNLALESLGLRSIHGWRGLILHFFGYEYTPYSILGNMAVGLLFWLPIYVVTLVAGGIAEIIFALVRGHEVAEGFFVTSILFSLIMPATIPLWQVAIGIIFGVVIGKEIFGGQGKNFMNPALVGRAFLYFAYPQQITGDSVWVGVDAFSGATALNIGAAHGLKGIVDSGVTWADSFVGTIYGCIGETSTLAISIGLVFLLVTRIANWRLIVGCLGGTAATVWLLNFIGSKTNPMFALPLWWHLVLGGYAFGLAFMVTEPVSASITNTGRYIYGALIGFMDIMIRVVNPAYPEGMMLAILFGNMFAPLIDYFVMQANIKKRAKRNANAL